MNNDRGNLIRGGTAWGEGLWITVGILGKDVKISYVIVFPFLVQCNYLW